MLTQLLIDATPHAQLAQRGRQVGVHGCEWGACSAAQQRWLAGARWWVCSSVCLLASC